MEDLSHCTTGCPTRDHASYGACLRSKSVATTGLESTGPGFGRSTQKSWDKELDSYRSAVQSGIQPATTNQRDIDLAVRASDEQGIAFRADA